MGHKIGHVPNEKTRGQVQALSGFGIKAEDIASYIGIAKQTLYKHYREELMTGVVGANARVAETLYNKAINGDTTACIFWLKTRAKWREVQKMEMEVDADVKSQLEMKTTLADLMIKNYGDKHKENQ